MSYAIDQLQMQLNTAKDNKAAIQTQIAQCGSQMDALQDQKDELGNQIKSLQDAISTLNGSSNTIPVTPPIVPTVTK